MASHKGTIVDKHIRVAQMVRLISNGAVTSELVRYAADHWGLKRRQAETYIAEARDVIVADINQDRQIVVAEMMSVCRTVIKNGMKSGNLQAVLGAVNSISKMGGLEPK